MSSWKLKKGTRVLLSSSRGAAATALTRNAFAVSQLVVSQSRWLPTRWRRRPSWVVIFRQYRLIKCPTLCNSPSSLLYVPFFSLFHIYYYLSIDQRQQILTRKNRRSNPLDWRWIEKGLAEGVGTGRGGWTLGSFFSLDSYYSFLYQPQRRVIQKEVFFCCCCIILFIIYFGVPTTTPLHNVYKLDDMSSPSHSRAAAAHCVPVNLVQWTIATSKLAGLSRSPRIMDYKRGVT